jgi:hypothetical protein
MKNSIIKLFNFITYITSVVFGWVCVTLAGDTFTFLVGIVLLSAGVISFCEKIVGGIE